MKPENVEAEVDRVASLENADVLLQFTRVMQLRHHAMHEHQYKSCPCQYCQLTREIRTLREVRRTWDFVMGVDQPFRTCSITQLDQKLHWLNRQRRSLLMV